MKSVFLFTASLLFSIFINAQPTTCTNPAVNITPPATGPYNYSIMDFGAVPNDNCSDQEAFEAAAAFFNVALAKVGGNCSGEVGTLYIPDGTYIVGKQVPAIKLLDGVSPLDLSDICNLTITGDRNGGSKIQMEQCMYYGSFRENGSGGLDRLLPSGSCPAFIDAQYLCDVGNMFQFAKSENLSISNINLWGGSDYMHIGGRYGDHGIQARGDGMTFDRCQNIEIENCSSQKMGRDGIMVMNFEQSQGCADIYYPVNISINNSTFDWNGRNGFSIAGGSHYYVRNSTFNHNGQGRVSSQTMSGVDIELHGFCLGIPKMISDINFTNCKFMFNEATGILNNYDNVRPLPRKAVENINFENCLVVSSEKGHAIKTSAKKTTFTSSKIHGATLGFYPVDLSYSPSDLDNRTIFQDCNFYDTWQGQLIGGGGWILHGNMLTVATGTTHPAASGVLMRGCNIYSGCGKIAFRMHANWDPAAPAVFENVHWYYTGGNFPVQWISNVWRNVNFDGFYLHLPPGSPIAVPSGILSGPVSCYGGLPCETSCVPFNGANGCFGGNSYHEQIIYVPSDPGITLTLPCSDFYTNYTECPSIAPLMNHSFGGGCTSLVTEPIGSCPPRLIPCEPPLDLPDARMAEAPVDRSITIYPNPASDLATLEIGNSFTDKKVTIRITDLAGAIHLQEVHQNAPDYIQVELASLQNGLYLVAISTEDGHIATESIMIAK